MRERWRNVSVKECFGTILFAIILFGIILIVPFSFSESGIVYTFQTMPFIGDGLFLMYGAEALTNFLGLIPEASVYAELAPMVFTYGVYAFFIILAADVVFALLLILTKFKLLRTLFRLISLISSLVMLVLGSMFILYITGFVASLIMAGNFENIVNDIILLVQTKGVTTALALSIASYILVRKQLKWFKKPAWANKRKYK